MFNTITMEKEEKKYYKIDKSIQEYESFLNDSPYHLNIIEELHANENSHSRILAKLFRYKDEKGQYSIFKSFIEYLKNNNHDKSFDDIVISNPKITQEEERIDIWIRDEKYALIIENKVYDAGDQNAQLCRYIDKTKDCGYKEEQIFIVYMPSAPREASKQAWGKYEESYQNRYAVVTFFEDVISWLDNYVLPYLILKEVYLKSAIEQYIDYMKRYAGVYEKNRQQHILKMLYEICDIKDTDTSVNQYKKLMTFHSELGSCINNCDNDRKKIFNNLSNQFEKITNTFYGENYEIIFQKEYNWIQILKREWEKFRIHFEWINPSFFEGKKFIYVLHAEGGEQICEKIIENMKKENFDLKNDHLSYPTCYEKSFYIKKCLFYYLA